MVALLPDAIRLAFDEAWQVVRDAGNDAIDADIDAINESHGATKNTRAYIRALGHERTKRHLACATPSSRLRDVTLLSQRMESDCKKRLIPSVGTLTNVALRRESGSLRDQEHSCQDGVTLAVIHGDSAFVRSR